MDQRSRVLVVDLDKTLLKIDVLAEQSLDLLLRHPIRTLRNVFSAKSKLHFKLWIASNYAVRPSTLPFRAEVLEIIEQYRQLGGKIVLATASVSSIANPIASHLGLFDEVLASSSSNLKGKAKASALQARFGVSGFDYVGDSVSDVHVWRIADRKYIVSDEKRAARVGGDLGLEPLLASRSKWALLRALRVNHWTKNLLVFLPVLMALSFEAEVVLPLFLMFLGLSFSASALYLINDLLDLESDRAHAEKRNRPSASGELTVWAALASSAGLFVCSILLAYLASSWTGIGLVVIYAALSLAYTLKLKNLPLVDVTALSLLYVYRLVIGGLISQVFVSYWLLAFAFFIFLSLAALKRVTELSALSEAYDAVGTSIAKRGYLPTDTDLVKSVGIAFAVGSVGLLTIYIEASFESVSGTQVLPFLLVPLAAVWILGLWLDQQRGTMGHDPVRHAYKDKRSLLLLTSMFLVYVMGRLG